MKIIKNLFLVCVIFVISSGLLSGQTYNYFSTTYDANGVPNNLADTVTITQNMKDYINTNLPDGTSIPNSMLKNEVFELNFSGSGSAPVWLTYVTEDAGYNNALGFYTYTGDDPSTTANIDTILFPNVAQGTDGGLIGGEQFLLGDFPSGTKFGWFVVADGWNNGQDANGDWVVENSSYGTIYSTPTLNDNDKIHCIYLEYEPFSNDGEESKILLAFEDQKNGDDDYNDLIFYISTFYDYSLPVELSSFNGTLKNSSVQLTWTTNSETKNRGFILERRMNSGQWIAIASYRNTSELIGKGNTSEATNYQYTDREVAAGNIYEYRLTDVDESNEKNIHETKIVKIDFQENISVTDNFSISSIYPNPFNPTATIEYQLPEKQQVQINVYDMSGKLMENLWTGVKNAGLHRLTFNATDYPSGIYFVHLTNGRKISIQKCIFMK